MAPVPGIEPEPRGLEALVLAITPHRNQRQCVLSHYTTGRRAYAGIEPVYIVSVRVEGFEPPTNGF